MPAANPLRGEAAFAAGGETFTLAYDINAMILAEEQSGLDMDQLLDRLSRGTNVKAIRATIWAGLQRHHECNLLRAGEIMAEATVPVARAAMMKAIRSAFPPAEAGEAANPRPAADGTGSAGSDVGAPRA